MNSVKKAFAFFYEEVGAKYPEEEEVYHTLRGRLRRAFILHQLQQLQGRLLDVGCNSGHYLAAYQNGERFGVDISRSVLRRADKDLKACLLVADAERLQTYRPAVFDAVLCSEVLEHCLNPQSVFAGFAHVLKPGGRGLITTPNYKGKRPGWIPMDSLTDYGVQGDFDGKYFHSAFHPQELCALAESVGLNVVQSGTLEKEVKFAAKIPAAILMTGRLVNRIFHSRRMEQWLLKVFNVLSIWIYEFCKMTRLHVFFMHFVKEGVRSFVLLEKPR